MKIKRLELDNFRQFKGQQVIIFSLLNNSNLTLILGDNTSGKTTLLQSFLWCLYGKVNFKSKESMLLNADAQEELKVSNGVAFAKVSLTLDFRNKEYIITRSQRFSVRNGEVRPGIVKTEMVFKDENGIIHEIEEDEIVSTVESIMPYDLSSYFFYDTERFGNVTTKNDVYEAVNTLLGLKVLQKAIEHLGTEGRSGTVIQRFYSDLDLSGNEKALEAKDKIEECEKDLEISKSRHKNIIEELEKYRELKSQVETKLKDLEETALLQNQIEEKEKTYANMTVELYKFQVQLTKAFNNNNHHFLLGRLTEQASSILEDVDLLDKGIKDMNAKSVEDIIKRGKCICGTEICIGNEAHQHLMYEMQYLPPQSLGNIVRNYRTSGNFIGNASNSFFETIDTQYKNYREMKRKLAVVHSQIEKLKEKIDGKESVKKYTEQRKDYEDKIEQLTIEKGRLLQTIEDLEKTYSKAKKKFEDSKISTGNNQVVWEQIHYARAAKEFIQNYYNSQVKTTKDSLQNKVDMYFQRMYHGNRKLTIDEKYKVKLTSTIGQGDAAKQIETDESQGLETVKNFSFISGLVDLAKNIMKTRVNSIHESDNEDYFLILDAPFSNTDATHVKKISEVLPEVASQLILIVMAKDWNYAEETMVDVVGKRYELKKHTETYTEIAEVGVN